MNDTNKCQGWVNPSTLNYAPHINNLIGYQSPAGSNTIVSINGTNFLSYSVVRFETFTPTVYFINSNLLQFYVPNTLNSGTYPVQVFNGSIMSNIVNFTIDNASGYWLLNSNGTITNTNTNSNVSVSSLSRNIPVIITTTEQNNPYIVPTNINWITGDVSNGDIYIALPNNCLGRELMIKKISLTPNNYTIYSISQNIYDNNNISNHIISGYSWVTLVFDGTYWQITQMNIEKDIDLETMIKTAEEKIEIIEEKIEIIEEKIETVQLQTLVNETKTSKLNYNDNDNILGVICTLDMMTNNINNIGTLVVRDESSLYSTIKMDQDFILTCGTQNSHLLINTYDNISDLYPFRFGKTTSLTSNSYTNNTTNYVVNSTNTSTINTPVFQINTQTNTNNFMVSDTSVSLGGRSLTNATGITIPIPRACARLKYNNSVWTIDHNNGLCEINDKFVTVIETGIINLCVDVSTGIRNTNFTVLAHGSYNGTQNGGSGLIIWNTTKSQYPLTGPIIGYTFDLIITRTFAPYTLTNLVSGGFIDITIIG